jgi:hypothetical protein
MSARRAFIKLSDKPSLFDEVQDASNNLIDTLQQTTIDHSVSRITSAESRLNAVEATRATVAALNAAVTSLETFATDKANAAQANAATYTDAAKADALLILRGELADEVLDLSGRVAEEIVGLRDHAEAYTETYADARLVDAEAFASARKAEAITEAGLYTDLKHGQAVAHADANDTALRTATTGWIATAKAAAISDAAAHADAALAEAVTDLEAFATTIGDDAILNAHGYTDAAKSAVLVIVDNKKQEAIETAETFATLKKTEALAYADAREVVIRSDLSGLVYAEKAAVRADADAHADAAVAAARLDLEAYAVARKSEALSYADTKKAEAISAANAHADAAAAAVAADAHDELVAARLDLSGRIVAGDAATLSTAVSTANNYTNTKVAEGVSQAGVYTDTKVAALDTDLSGRIWKVLSWIDAVRQAIFISGADGETEFDYSVFGAAFGSGSSSSGGATGPTGPAPPAGKPIVISAIWTGWDAALNGGAGGNYARFALTSTVAGNYAIRIGLRDPNAPPQAGAVDDQRGAITVSITSGTTIVRVDNFYPNPYNGGNGWAYYIGDANDKKSDNFYVDTASGRTGPQGQTFIVFGNQAIFT